MSVTPLDDVWIDLHNPTGRARKLRLLLRQHPDEPYFWICGAHDNGELMYRQSIRLPLADIDNLILALQKFRAGPLGKLAIEYEAHLRKISTE